MAHIVEHSRHAVVIGAGIAGLCSAARLCAAGFQVTVIERADQTGGKIRAVPTQAGDADAGPTVLTMKDVFEEVFALLGTSLSEHVSLERCQTLARHVWPDGTVLDLTGDPQADQAAIGSLFGATDARGFLRFTKETAALFEAFHGPMMQTANPSLLRLAATVASRPALLRAMAPHRSLNGYLETRFSDPRLVQLFGRYATYVGGSPLRAPALLSLIWQAEQRGVWRITEGLAALPRALERLCRARGVTFRLGETVDQITCTGGRATGVSLPNGERLPADLVVFNGDPRALATGALGPDVAGLAPQTKTTPRSLSALVWSFAATVTGPALSHHNVFFSADNRLEFTELAQGRIPSAPSVYLCAQDRNAQLSPPSGPERFELIVNAPADTVEMDFTLCQIRTFQALARHGLTFDPMPGPEALTQPADFAARYPASLGALYGQSPHGLTASLSRPRARTSVPGLYLAGGGAHPGAGIPMAALSARHAVETILTDLSLPSMSRPTDTPGGISTGSAPTAAAPSR